MQKTNIQWCDFSANPLKYKDAAGNVVWGCVKTSPGCRSCYAETLAHRYGRGGPFTRSVMEGLTPFLDEAELHKMLTYKPASGKRVFVADMTDLFGEWIPDSLLDRLFAVFALRRDVTWQILTKRAERMREYLTTPARHNSLELAADALFPGKGHPSFGGKHMLPGLPLPNVWLGVSVENQQYADERIPHLLQTPAAVRFLSCEPMLGPIDLSQWLPIYRSRSANGETSGPWLRSTSFPKQSPCWVIVGGESGHGARPCDVAWIRSLVQQCRVAGVACFVKQLGSKPVENRAIVLEAGESLNDLIPAWDRRTGKPIKDSKGGDFEEWSEDLRVREMPS